MKRFSLSLSALLLLCFSLTGQNNRDYYPPTNIRNASDYLPGHVDLIWSPPEGWQPSRVDRWFEYDRGILGVNAIGSCPGCPVEIAIRWDSGFFHNYNAVYLTKIRYVLRESALDHALRVYQVQNGIFDTLFNYPLQNNLVYYRFDTTEFTPITIDKSKELWVGLWVSDMGPVSITDQWQWCRGIKEGWGVSTYPTRYFTSSQIVLHFKGLFIRRYIYFQTAYSKIISCISSS